MNKYMMTDPELPNSETFNSCSIQLPVKSNVGNANQYYLQGLNPCLPSAYVSCQQVEEDGQPSREKLILSLDDGYSTDGRSNSAASTSSPISASIPSSISSTSTFELSPFSAIGNTSAHQDSNNEEQINMHRDPIEKRASVLAASRSTVGKHKALHANRRDVLAESPETTFSLEERLRALTTIEEEDTAVQDRGQYRFLFGHSVSHSLARLSQSLASSPLNARHNKRKVVKDRQPPSTTTSSTFAQNVPGCYRAVPIHLNEPQFRPNSTTSEQEVNCHSQGAFASHLSTPLVNGEGWKDYATFFEKETDIPPHNIDPAGKGKFTNASVDDVPDMDINRQIGVKTNNRINNLRFREFGDQAKQSVNQSTATTRQSRIMGKMDSKPHQLINKAPSVSGIGTRQRDIRSSLPDLRAYRHRTQPQLSTQQQLSTQPQYLPQPHFSAQPHPPTQQQLSTQQHISKQPQYSTQPLFPAQQQFPMQQQPSAQPHLSTSSQHSTQPQYSTQPHLSALPQSQQSKQSQLSYSYHPSSPMTSPGTYQEEQELNDLYIEEEEQNVDHDDAEDQCITPTNYLTDSSPSYCQKLQQRQHVAHNQRYVNLHQQYCSALDVSQTNNSHVRDSPYSSIQDHYNSSNYPDVVLRRTKSCNSPRASAPTRHERYSWQAENRSVQDAYSDAADIRTTPIPERASLCLGSIPQLQKQIRATSELCLQASRRHMFASSADIYKLFSGQTKSPVPSSPVIQRHSVDTDLRVNSNYANHGGQRSNDNDSQLQDFLPSENSILSRSRMDIVIPTSMVEGNSSSLGPIRSHFQQPIPTNHQQTLSSNHQQAMLTNHQHDLPTNHQQAMPTNYQQAISTNQQQAMPTNHQQTIPTNHQQAMTTSSWTNEHFLPPLGNALYNRYGQVLAFNEGQDSYSCLDEHLMDMNRSQGASCVDIHSPNEFYQTPNTTRDIQRHHQLPQRSLSADIAYHRRSNAQHELDDSLYTEALFSSSGFIKSHCRRPPTAEPVLDNSMIQRPQTTNSGWDSPGTQRPQTSDLGWDTNRVQRPQTSDTEWDSPKVERPQTSNSGWESVLTHRPSSSNSGWDSPRVQRPQATDPVLDNPMIHRPSTSNPGWDNPRVQRPQATDPVLDNPMIHRPSTSNPGWDSPTAQRSQATDPVLDNPMSQRPPTSNPGWDSPRVQRPHIIDPELNNPLIQRPPPSNPGRDIPRLQRQHTADQILDNHMIQRPQTSIPGGPSSMFQKTQSNPLFDKPMYQRQSSGYSSESELQQIEFNAEKRYKQSSSDKKSFQQGNVQDCLLPGTNNTSSDQTLGGGITDEPVYANIAGVKTTKESSNEGWVKTQPATRNEDWVTSQTTRNEGWMTPQTTKNEGWMTQQATKNLGWMTPQTTKRGLRNQLSNMQPVVEGMYPRSHELYANYPNDKLFSKTDTAKVVERSQLKYTNIPPVAPQNTPKDFEHNNTASGSSKSNPRFIDPVLTQKQIINFNKKPVTITSVVPPQFDYEDDLKRKADAPNLKSNYPLTPSVSVLWDYPVNPQQRVVEPRHYGTGRLTAASAAGYKHDPEGVSSTVQSNRNIRQDNGGSGNQLSPRVIAQSMGTPFATNIFLDEQGDTLSTLV